MISCFGMWGFAISNLFAKVGSKTKEVLKERRHLEVCIPSQFKGLEKKILKEHFPF